MKRRFQYAVWCVWGIMLMSCTREVSQEELIREAVAIRLEKWKLEQFDLCREKAMEKAEAYVDSLLLVTSLETKLDTIPKPGKPEKPLKPEFRSKPDSVIVQPIYKKED